MKHFLLILSLIFVTSAPLFAQEDDDGENDKIQDKMSEYIQKRLDLTKEEATKFTPVFLRYFKEWRQTIRLNRGDKLVMQQKVIALRLQYRTQFREIMGERRGDQVFMHQERFIQELREIRKERLRNNPGVRPLRRGATNFIIK
jgi:hypothetical protein